jgi:ribonuclease P protein component
MIARKNRFHGHRSVSKVRGLTINSDNISLRFQKTNRADYRLAVVVSKKTAPKAVMRNRIRRRIFEAVRIQKRLNGIPIDVVIYVKSSKLESISASELQDEVLQLTKKALQRLQ